MMRHLQSIRFGMVLAAACLPLGWAEGLAAGSPPGKVLLNDDFEAAKPGEKPARWGIYVDEGNDIAVVETPALGKRALRFTDAGGTVWKPLLSAGISGEAESFLRVDCDWRLNRAVDRHERAFTVVLRGNGNCEVATVALGGPGGVAVRQKGLEWVSLGVPLQWDAWGHLTIIADPIAWGERGAFTVILTQGSERAVFPNIPFCLPKFRNEYPKEYWHSPCFSLAGVSTAGAGVEAYLDNVRVEVVERRNTR